MISYCDYFNLIPYLICLFMLILLSQKYGSITRVQKNSFLCLQGERGISSKEGIGLLPLVENTKLSRGIKQFYLLKNCE